MSMIHWTLGFLVIALVPLACSSTPTADAGADARATTSTGGADAASTGGVGGTTSTSTGGTTSTGTGGTISTSTGGTTSAGMGGATSTGMGGSLATGKGGATLTGTGGTSAGGTGGMTVSVTSGGTTAGTGGTTSTGTGETTATGSGGKTSSGTGGATPGTGGTASAGTGGSTGGAPVTVYQVIQGHDGDADPDDNLAQLTGMMAIYHNKTIYPGQIEMIGLVFGDTTVGHKSNMKGSGAGHGNWLFFQQYSTPALGDSSRAWYLPANIHDSVPQSWDFAATQVSQLSTGGQMVYRTLKAALDNTDTSNNYRVVFAAGGGHNSPYEAIQLLRKSTTPVYSDAQILAHFAIVQHSDWNMDNTNEAGVLTGTLPFTIRISDQNATSGPGMCGIEPALAKTSAQFIKSSRVARGVQAPDQAMSGFGPTTDCSDAGASDFASTPSLMESNWNTRNNRANAISYSAFNTAKITSILQ